MAIWRLSFFCCGALHICFYDAHPQLFKLDDARRKWIRNTLSREKVN